MSCSYDKKPINQNILVDMCLDEYSTPPCVTSDKAKGHHPFALTGAWGSLANGLPYVTLNPAIPNFIQCPAALSADVNITTENLTLFACVNGTSDAARHIMNQGVVDVDGWQWFVFGNNISFRLNRGGAHSDISAVGVFTDSVPLILHVTRAGAVGQFFVNGLPVTTIGTLVNAVSCAGGNKLLVGVQNDEATQAWNGIIYGGECAPKIWLPRALTAAEILEHTNSIRHWLGV